MRMSAQQQPLVDRLQEFVFRRYQTSASVRPDRIPDRSHRLFAPDPELIALLRERRLDVLSTLRHELEARGPLENQTLLYTCIVMAERYIYHVNQFITLTTDDQSRLLNVYRRLLAGLVDAVGQERAPDEMTQTIGDLIQSHFVALSGFFQSLSDAHPALRTQVVCSEYTPGMQLSLLGLDARALPEPILDLGCGESGALVGYLRGLGLRAFGIDRVVFPSPYLRQADWLALDFAPLSWGTILSHMAFSNHFVFQHHAPDGEPERYARQFVVLLEALKVGGLMAYAPGLPFIEPLLPRRYEVRRRPVALPSGAAQPSVDLYAAQIRRLA